MKDIQLKGDGDLYITPEGDIVIIDSIAQAIAIRLRWFLGEWKFNTALGFPYFEDVLVKNPNLSLVEQRITEEILAVAGVRSVTSVKLTMDKEERTVLIAFKAVTGTGEASGEVSVNA